MTRVRHLLTGACAVLAVAIALVYFLLFQPMLGRGRQVRTLSDMNLLRSYLGTYRERHGEYPRFLDLAMPEKYRGHRWSDAFGNPFLYESLPDAYVLVSFGADGEPDGSDYWELRNRKVESRSVDYDFEADQVLSDVGWHRQAGK